MPRRDQLDPEIRHRLMPIPLNDDLDVVYYPTPWVVSKTDELVVLDAYDREVCRAVTPEAAEAIAEVVSDCLEDNVVTTYYELFGD